MSYLPNLRDVTLTPQPELDRTPAPSVVRLLVNRRSGEQVGLRGRRLFAELRLWRRARNPRLERFYWHVLKPVFAAVLILWYTPQYAGAIRRQFGIPVLRQIASQCRLGFRDWVNPRNYYFHEHYRAEGTASADGYVMRHEIKEGLLKTLHKLRPKVHGQRVNLGHKLGFAAVCARFDLPTPPVLAVVRRGHFEFGKPETLACDLFVKPEHGRGAIGARAYLRAAPAGSHAGTDRSATLEGVLAGVARRSWIRPQILQPLLRNHPAIADFADHSLVTIRVFTCFDAENQPVVTHAMLRTISKLEPDWPVSEEYAAAIDLATGRLGLMCGDSRIGPDAWYETHPVTGCRVAGRIVPQWPAIHDLAVAAHKVFSDRMILGWDIALTPDGPSLIEANSYPDTEFLQRVHRQPIGASPLGPLLAHHFDRLEETRGGFLADRKGA